VAEQESAGTVTPLTMNTIARIFVSLMAFWLTAGPALCACTMASLPPQPESASARADGCCDAPVRCDAADGTRDGLCDRCGQNTPMLPVEMPAMATPDLAGTPVLYELPTAPGEIVAGDRFNQVRLVMPPTLQRLAVQWTC
jgi:hypothetical protein